MQPSAVFALLCAKWSRNEAIGQTSETVHTWSFLWMRVSISSKVTTSGLALDEYCAWRMAARDLGANEREVWYRAGIAREVKEGMVSFLFV